MSGQKSHIVIQKSSLQNDMKEVDKIVGKTPCLLLVHASWCYHCIQLMQDQKNEKGVIKESEWTKFKKSAVGKKVPIIEIEYDVHQEIVKKYKDTLLGKLMKESVQGFPFIAIIGVVHNDNVDVHLYDRNSRTVQDLKSFTQDKMRVITTKTK